jgi:hypothetical protein
MISRAASAQLNRFPSQDREAEMACFCRQLLHYISISSNILILQEK